MTASEWQGFKEVFGDPYFALHEVLKIGSMNVTLLDVVTGLSCTQVRTSQSRLFDRRKHVFQAASLRTTPCNNVQFC
eukprot:3975638-Amphidinium_carterae.1